MTIEIEIHRPIECESYDEAFGRAYALSKMDGTNATFYVVKTMYLFTVMPNRKPLMHQGKLICGFRRGIKTVWP